MEEIQKKHQVIRKGDAILDIGCSPGSWVQYTQEHIGDEGSIVGVDVQPLKIDSQKNITFIQRDIFEVTVEEIQAISPLFDCIMSDAAPNTSGDRFTDCQKSLRICERVFELSRTLLKKNGNLIMKIFQGEDFPAFYHEVKKSYKVCKTQKPHSSRKESYEVFIVGKNKV